MTMRRNRVQLFWPSQYLYLKLIVKQTSLRASLRNRESGEASGILPNFYSNKTNKLTLKKKTKKQTLSFRTKQTFQTMMIPSMKKLSLICGRFDSWSAFVEKEINTESTRWRENKFNVGVKCQMNKSWSKIGR